MRRYTRGLFICLTLAFLGVLFVATVPRDTSAVAASDWNAGNIIDDSVFTSAGSMSVADIQNFLDKRVGTGSNGIDGQCDTNGTRTSELGGGTRAQYGAANGNPAPFTCLKDFYEVPKVTPGPSVPLNNYGGKPIPAGAKSAARLIWDAAQKYNISPKVLLVKLGTESAGPLTSDDWPFLKQYTYAMGAHCPDSGPGGSANCDPNYSGFSIQISEAAALLRGYLDNMTESWWPYKRPGPGVVRSGVNSNYVAWNVPDSCGGTVINIANKATAALYTYTPYQPNQAALNNMYGTGNSCSSYGNRNFWRTYNDWFGSSQGVDIYAIGYDTTTDKTGEQGKVGFGLSQRPTSNVTLSFYVSSPSNAKIIGSSTLTITRDNWNRPEKNVITMVGQDNDNLVGNFQYSLKLSKRPQSSDIRYRSLGSDSLEIKLLQQDVVNARSVYRVYSEETQKHLFTASKIERDALVADGWRAEGAPFTYCSAGNKLITRLVKGAEYRLAAQNSDLEDSFLTEGFTRESLVFTASSQGNIPVYWRYDQTNKRSLYTTSLTEGLSSGFTDKGIAFYGCESQSKPVYRLNKPGGSHFFTTTSRERDKAIYDLGYRYEGVGFYACSGGTVPVYRFIKPSNGIRFYTTSTTERDKAQNILKYTYEGVAFSLCTDSSRDVHRLYSPSTGFRFYTVSSSEKDSAAANSGYTYEGVGFKTE